MIGGWDRASAGVEVLAKIGTDVVDYRFLLVLLAGCVALVPGGHEKIGLF